MQIRESDLACERGRADEGVEGVTVLTREGPFPITEVNVTSEAGARGIGRPRGRYVTVEFPPLFRMFEEERVAGAELLSSLLSAMLPKGEKPLLVVGLGNREMTADALGARCVELLQRCDHGLFLCAPGVQAQSGMEAAQVVHALTEEVRPRAVAVIDALCARSCKRLACTVQLSDTGLVPGSGIREPKRGISPKELGIPVVSIGVPTAVPAVSLLADVLRGAQPSVREELLGQADRLQPHFVLPREIDVAVEGAARLIADAILAL